ncbi:MAG: hypothetical protein ABI690_12080 [Chloroflexota bacterium]
MELDSFNRVGGVRIGRLNATFPLATLTCNRNELTINVMWLISIKKYTFQPQQVISIAPYTSIPLIGWGIQIRHTVLDYNSFFVFWCLLRSPSKLAEQIQAIGFIPQGKDS